MAAKNGQVLEERHVESLGVRDCGGGFGRGCDAGSARDCGAGTGRGLRIVSWHATAVLMSLLPGAVVTPALAAAIRVAPPPRGVRRCWGLSEVC